MPVLVAARAPKRSKQASAARGRAPKRSTVAPQKTAAPRAAAPSKAAPAVPLSAASVLANVLTRRLALSGYDAAKTTNNNRRRWEDASLLTADGALSPEVRKTMVSRCRHENENNPYVTGITEQLAYDMVGSAGPRLQLTTPDEEANRRLEASWDAWFQAIDGSAKLRTMREQQCVDGEIFGLFITNPKVNHEVMLDLRLIETDQVADLTFRIDAQDSDGITFDEHGNAVSYSVLKEHPGARSLKLSMTADIVQAEMVVHLFKRRRATQSRGVPELASSLSTFADLRAYTGATLSAAEIAALFAGVLYTDAPANVGPAAIDPMELIELERGSLMTMPQGWKMGQVKAEQPVTGFGEFKGEALNEGGRPLHMPSNIVKASSKDMNFSSGQLDHMLYWSAVDIDRSRVARMVLDRLFAEWIREASMIPGMVPPSLRDLLVIPHKWFWPPRAAIDPEKKENSRRKRLEDRMTTYAREFALEGLDWEQEFAQMAKEQALAKKLGITIISGPVAQQQLQQKARDESDEDDADDSADESDAKKETSNAR